MKIIKKIFGGINLTWDKLILLAIIAGLYCGGMAMLPIAKDTSFEDIAATFEVWIFFGIFIISNSKSNKDAALKCFVFFLISQPLVYFFEDLILHENYFAKYYRNWIGWTIACLPMGYIGYYMKKDKWWTAIILAPMLILLAYSYYTYGGQPLYWFPRHLLTSLYCIAALFIFPLVLENKTARLIDYLLSGLLFVVVTALILFNPYTYKTSLGSSNTERFGYFDNTYKAYFEDKNMGDVKIEYHEGIEDYMLETEFKHGGKTKLILEAPDGKKEEYSVDVRFRTYAIEKIKKEEK